MMRPGQLAFNKITPVGVAGGCETKFPDIPAPALTGSGIWVGAALRALSACSCKLPKSRDCLSLIELYPYANEPQGRFYINFG